MFRRLAVALALVGLLWLPGINPSPPAQAASCTGWPSIRIPPNTIRVLRSSTGRVQVVDFKTYVARVLDVEWPSGWPTAAIEAGAIAVKQYGWYYTMHWRGGTAHGACYDVQDNTYDQIYRDITPSAAFTAAVTRTWDVSITRSGSFIMTGYRSGASVMCGVDADGYHLFQHSSYYCATMGMTADQILNVYYGPLDVWRSAAPPGAVFLLPAGGGITSVGTSATVAWAESPAAGTTIASRLLSLTMALPRNGSCNVDRWVTASPGWQSTGASPQTIEGLLPGYCYRLLVSLTDSNGATTQTQSGPMIVDPQAPTVVFTSPNPGAVTPITATTVSVRWTESVLAGRTVSSRRLTVERAAQPVPGSCAAAMWSVVSNTTAASPVSVGVAKWYCYRFRMNLTDSAGHAATAYSGIVVLPAS